MKVITMPQPTNYDFSTPVIDLTTGKPHLKQVISDLTVKDVIIGALMAPDNNALHAPAEREARLSLAEKISAGTVTLTHEEVGLIRKACALATPTQFYGWVMRALEGKA